MDNASNNDTMVEAFARRCEEKGIEFSAKDGRMRCMPHTVHLAALKVCRILLCSTKTSLHSQLLEVIGVLTKEEAKKAETNNKGNYQEATTTPLGRDEDIECGEDDEDESNTEDADDLTNPIKHAIVKVRTSLLLRWLS